MFVAVNGILAGALSLADPIRPSSKEAVGMLHGENVKIVMATGDRRATAEHIASQLGIDEVEAEISPAGKARAGQKASELRARLSPWPAMASTTHLL